MARPSNYDLRSLMPGVSYDVEDIPEDRSANIINQSPDALDYTIQGLLDKHLGQLYQSASGPGDQYPDLGEEAAAGQVQFAIPDPAFPQRRQPARRRR